MTGVIFPEPPNRSVTHEDTSNPLQLAYEVYPSHQLPTLDLSITLKSRFLSRSNQRLFERCMRHRELILVGYSFTVLIYFATMVTTPRIGQILSTIGMLLGLPGTCFVLSALRYDALRVLLPTYDVIFFDTIVVATLVVLMAMLGDARAMVVSQALVAYQINIAIDANIQAVRRVTIVNTFAMLMSAFVGLTVAMDTIPQLRHFTLVAYGPHILDARSFVTDGFITILAIMLRNTYRKRAILFKRSAGAVIDCVSYRCHLAIRQHDQRSLIVSTGPPVDATTVSFPNGLRPRHIQTMRYVAHLPLIHAQQVMLPRMFLWLLQSDRRRVKQLTIQVLGYVSASLLVGVGVYEFTEFKYHQSSRRPPDKDHAYSNHTRLAIAIATILTLVYVATCATLYQRTLLRALITSFDFIFLSTQLTFVHVATADFFRWHPNCVLLVATWLWSHWVFCVDAITPCVRGHIGYSTTFAKLVMAALVMSTGLLNHLLLFSDGFISINDRILWSGNVLGRHLEFRLLSTFYSTYVTVMAWALRLLWRVVFARHDEFVLLDGAVAFDNYLRQPNRSLKSRLFMLRASATQILHQWKTAPK